MRSGPGLNDLVALALQEWDSERSWGAIRRLQMLGSPETLAVVRRLATSRNWRKRALGFYIASQLRPYEKTSVEYALDETHSILLIGLQDEKDEVVAAAISGFGHRPNPLALHLLVNFAAHESRDIRFQVAAALGRYQDEAAIATLLALATDPDEAVRDWATFGLGSMQVADTPELREGLWRNIDDSSDDVRGEALVGLAIRKDDRIISVLMAGLNSECRTYEFEAAEQMANPVFLDRLNALKDSVLSEEEIDSYWYRRLEDAISACSAQSST